MNSFPSNQIPSKERFTCSLSFAQQRLWFLDQLQGSSIAYNVSRAFRLSGPLQLTALEESFKAIIRRHETLRTVFSIVNEEVVQVIQPLIDFGLTIVDLTDQEPASAIHNFLREEAQRSFDFTQGPLIRVTLGRLDETEHILLLTVHHLVFDGWSLGVLLQELAAFYQAFLTHTPPLLPELPIQYADFTLWQREWLQGQVLQEQLLYWKGQLAGSPPMLELPTDRPRPAVQTSQGACHSLVLSETMIAGLKALSRQEGVTLFMTLLAAFKVLLSRYTGQTDMLVGTPIANRTEVELEPLIGFFANTLVLRTDLTGNPTFRELLERVRTVALGAYAHQDLPFEKLVEELQPARDLSHMPLFQVMFVFQNAPLQLPSLPGLTLTPMELDQGTARFDLTLTMVEAAEGLTGIFEYNTDLFDAATIARMAGHFQTLLAGIIAQPDTPISKLPLLTPTEERQLLRTWNETPANFAGDACLHQLFEAQAAQTPEAIALVFADQQFTYRELNRRANQVAHYLQALGVGPEILVAVCLDRSPELIISLLAVLKAGGAYVPLDPAYPPERLAFILQDTQAPVLLTQSQFLPNFQKYSGHPVCLDTDMAALAKTGIDNTQNPTSQVIPENLAYVIYTSGSTGQPKGVLISHDNVTRLFAATQAWFNFDESDVWTLFHSYAFDFSVWEIWGALCYGGRLVVVPYLVSRSPEIFYNLLHQEKVTVLNQTPSAFRQLIQVEEELGITQELKLRLVIFGGEVLEFNSLRPWFERHGDQSPQLVNMYGITETTVHVTYRPITWADLDLAPGSLIGWAIPDLQLYLLDQHLQPVPIGVPGELYVGGAGLGRGYLNRPELTAEKFIPNPFTPLSESNRGNDTRLYKSGDLVRSLANGDIAYLGRVDHQVKLRGFRIELGEIETRLSQHPLVRERVVLLREDRPGDKRLVAYIVPTQQPGPAASELRRWLKQKLPDYMIPSAFIILETLPLTPNGKLDRRVLPVPDQNRLPETFVAPRTPVEAMLAMIWAEVFHLEQVGLHDNFFELGGHSLIATQVISRLRNTFQVELPLRCLFERPTIAGLAQVLEENRVNKVEAEPAVIKPVSRQIYRARRSAAKTQPQ